MAVLSKITIRESDSWASDSTFGANRGNHQHQGVDLVAVPGQYVYSPFAGKITKYGYPYGSGTDFSKLRYIEITGEKYIARLFYCGMDPAFEVGDTVPDNQFIGTIQTLQNRYDGITDHLHFELRTLDRKVIDPLPFLKKKVQ